MVKDLAALASGASAAFPVLAFGSQRGSVDLITTMPAGAAEAVWTVASRLAGTSRVDAATSSRARRERRCMGLPRDGGWVYDSGTVERAAGLGNRKPGALGWSIPRQNYA